MKTIWFQFLFKLVYQQILYIHMYLYSKKYIIITLLKIPECLFYESSGHNLKE